MAQQKNQSHTAGEENKAGEQPLKAKGKHKEESAEETHWLEGELGSNVTLCINDANLCLGKCV